MHQLAAAPLHPPVQQVSHRRGLGPIRQALGRLDPEHRGRGLDVHQGDGGLGAQEGAAEPPALQAPDVASAGQVIPGADRRHHLDAGRFWYRRRGKCRRPWPPRGWPTAQAPGSGIRSALHRQKRTQRIAPAIRNQRSARPALASAASARSRLRSKNAPPRRLGFQRQVGLVEVLQRLRVIRSARPDGGRPSRIEAGAMLGRSILLAPVDGRRQGSTLGQAVPDTRSVSSGILASVRWRRKQRRQGPKSLDSPASISTGTSPNFYKGCDVVARAWRRSTRKRAEGGSLTGYSADSLPRAGQVPSALLPAPARRPCRFAGSPRWLPRKSSNT